MAGSTIAARLGFTKKVLSAFAGVMAKQQPAFVVCFAVLALFTARIHYLHPLSFGQDFHYHLMNAAMGARSTDEPVRRLYHWINPFDANTLLYTIAYPFEKLTQNPARAFELACTVAYWIGYPFGCAYALVRTGRSPWGALLAFPISYGVTATIGGYWPFLTGAALVAPALAEMQVLLRVRGRAALSAGVRCGVLTTGAFLAHAMVYGWLCALMAIHTLVVIASDVGIDGALSPHRGLRRALRVGGKSLAAVAPSVIIAVRWFYHVMWGAAAASQSIEHSLTPPLEPTLQDKIHRTLDALAPSTSDHEYWYMSALVILCFAAVLTGDRKSDALGPRIFERSFLLSALSFIVVPYWVHYEPTAPRQFDLAVLLFPLVIFPRRPRLLSATGAALTACFVFALARLSLMNEQLRILNNVDYAGLLATAEDCRRLVPHDRVSKLAYVNDNIWTSAFHAGGAQQSHETFAAICGLETPVYDTQIGPHNVLPLRYVGAMPAPITIVGSNGWYRSPGLWKNFEYVLVRGWHPTTSDQAALAPMAKRVAKHGVYELWERK